MMLFYRNLFVYSRVFFAVHLNARSTGPCSDCWPSHPVNLIQSLSFKSTRPRVNCNVEWRRLARALFSPASNFQAQFPNLNTQGPFIIKVQILIHCLRVITPQTPENVCFCLLIWCPDLFDNYWKKWPRAFKTRCDLAAAPWEQIWAWSSEALKCWTQSSGTEFLSIFFPYIFQSYISDAMTLLILLWAWACLIHKSLRR